MVVKAVQSRILAKVQYPGKFKHGVQYTVVLYLYSCTVQYWGSSGPHFWLRVARHVDGRLADMLRANEAARAARRVLCKMHTAATARGAHNTSTPVGVESLRQSAGTCKNTRATLACIQNAMEDKPLHRTLAYPPDILKIKPTKPMRRQPVAEAQTWMPSY